MSTMGWPLLLISIFTSLRQVEGMSSDSDTDVDVEFPRTKLVDTLETAHSVTVDDDRHPQGLYSYLSMGSVPPHLGHTGHVRKSLRRSAGRLDIRAPSCPEGSVQSCPDTGLSLIKHNTQVLMTIVNMEYTRARFAVS
ncbi:hypothetical protein FRC14_005412 [Serendipita sp. 396]|nr:hypothetical protein FRC14_005412 [Serendipita sp. 396]KAG8786470.1 hypothetical protein FRC15_011361 [Serendipita sp. 397]KAG8791162.1 hypothetical protein FRC16_000565 [Serendipita sp. 398]KAG8856076.1 hypothetical protein FRC20_000620 [Serendipita sp. 405]